MNDFIYNQHDIPKEQYRYGLRLPGRVIAPDCGPLHRDACLEALALHA